ncbi:hypothetical protein ACT7DG_25555 [Bacillus cereus]
MRKRMFFVGFQKRVRLL